MTELERRLNQLIDSLAPKGNTAKALSGIKDTLNSSSQLVDAVNNIGDDLQDNLKESVGGVTGAVTGWMAGKTTKLMGGIAGGVVAGTLRTVAGMIPDLSDIKRPENDRKIAFCINICPIPSDKNELFELLQYTWNVFNSKSTPFGKQAIESFKILHNQVYSAFLVVAINDSELMLLSKKYAPQKRYRLF